MSGMRAQRQLAGMRIDAVAGAIADRDAVDYIAAMLMSLERLAAAKRMGVVELGIANARRDLNAFTKRHSKDLDPAHGIGTKPQIAHS